MFDFISDRQLPRASARIVALRRTRQSVESRRRDIFESHRHRTFALAYYMTGNELEAEEILTGTFIKAFSAVEEPAGPDVDSALIDELRQRSLLDAAPEPQTSVTLDTAQPGADLSRNVKRTDLEEAIQELPSTERLLFLLRDVEGYSPDAIAKLLKMPEPEVRRTLMAARIHLRRILAEAQSGEEKAA